MYDTRINLLSILTLLLMLGVLGAMFVLRDRLPIDEGLSIPKDSVEPSRDWLENRVQDGLLALYTFDAGKGATLLDRSMSGDPLNLTTDASTSGLWRPDGIRLNGQAVFTSLNPADKITQTCWENHAFTLELWLTPESTESAEEAPIFAIHSDEGLVLAIAQGGIRDEHAGRLLGRSQTASPTGRTAPRLGCPEGLKLERTHLVMVGTITGRRILYLNSIVVADDHLSGDLSNWKNGSRVSVGGAPDFATRWKGRMHLAAIYDRALSAREIRKNFSQGLGEK